MNSDESEAEMTADEPKAEMTADEPKAAMIAVEVAYATPEKQLIIALDVPEGTSAYEAVMLSKITEHFEGIDPDKNPMGIFSKLLDGKRKPLPQEYQLQLKDRVEIYRPLLLDPKQARLKRADDSVKAEATQLAKKRAKKRAKSLTNLGKGSASAGRKADRKPKS